MNKKVGTLILCAQLFACSTPVQTIPEKLSSSSTIQFGEELPVKEVQKMVEEGVKGSKSMLKAGGVEYTLQKIDTFEGGLILTPNASVPTILIQSPKLVNGVAYDILKMSEVNTTPVMIGIVAEANAFSSLLSNFGEGDLAVVDIETKEIVLKFTITKK